ncbi:MAG TPA: DUF3168 domain-containing protein [Mesorhizobium sp.]|nr:DUF3168 domain-containing protein [Mesorhizobium sp.]
MEPTLALQINTRTRLVTAPMVTALVQPAHIVDRHARPEQFPAIVLGTAQTMIEAATFTRAHVRVVFDLHVWTKESGLEEAKTVAHAVRLALKNKPSIDGLQIVDWQVASTRFMRDPAEVGHAIVTVEALVLELVS